MKKNTITIPVLAFFFLLGIFPVRAETQDLPVQKQAAPLQQTEQQNKKQSGKQTVPLTLNWLEDYQQALRIAKEQNKPILLYFTGSDWCSWCFYLHKNLLDQKSFIQYANQSLVLMKADFPRKKPLTENLQIQNRKLAEKFRISGFPTVFILNPDEKIIAQCYYSTDPATRKPVFTTRTAEGKFYFAKPENNRDAGAAFAQNLQDIQAAQKVKK